MRQTLAMATPENADLVREFYRAGPSDDDTARSRFAVPEVVWHVPGDNPVAGRYVGYDQVFSTIGRRMQPLDEWTIEVREVMGNDDMVCAIVDLVAARGDHRVVCQGSHLFRFTPDGRIAEVWGFVADQADLDALFGS
jgi:ketosteroid isomerase-like protein